MENTNKERQVWQRVMAPAQSWAEADWQQLLNPAALSAGAYRYLMGALPPEHRMHQRADGVAILAARKIAAGEPGDAAALVPNYLRLSQAERERLEREQPAARG